MWDEGKSGTSGGTIAFFALFLIILFGLFSGRGFNGGVNGPVATFESGSNYVADRDGWMQHCDTLKQINSVNQNVDMQTASIQRQADARAVEILLSQNNIQNQNLRDQLTSERISSSELRNELLATKNFAALSAEICGVQRTLDRKLNTPPFIASGGFPQVANSCCC